MSFLVACLIVFFSTVSITNANFTNSECTEAGTTCLTCYSQKLCISAIFFNMYWTDWSCPVSTPYCDINTNNCTNIQPESCETADSVTCPRPEGSFPLLDDCSMYYDCENGTTTFFTCDPNYVYNQTFGKCLLKLSDTDCQQALCQTPTNVSVYPGDPSLYYECEAEGTVLHSCPEGSYFDSNTSSCYSVCVSDESVANTVNCSTYFSCSLSDVGYVAEKQSCPNGRGFNAVTKDCQASYDQLCNELALVERDLGEFFGFVPSIFHFLLEQFRNVLNLFGINVPTVLLAVGVQVRDISDALLIADYFYKYRSLPPPAINAIVNYIMGNIPDALGIILQIFFPSNAVAKRDVDTQNGLQDDLTNFIANIDVGAIFSAIQTQNRTVVESTVREQVLKALNLTAEDAFDLFSSSVEDVNAVLGADVVKVQDGGPEINFFALCKSLAGEYQSRLLDVYKENLLVGFAIQKFVQDNLSCLN